MQSNSLKPLLAIIDNYGLVISQWTWLYQALLEMSMNKIALWITVHAGDWTAERAIIASNELSNVYILVNHFSGIHFDSTLTRSSPQKTVNFDCFVPSTCERFHCNESMLWEHQSRREWFGTQFSKSSTPQIWYSLWYTLVRLSPYYTIVIIE